MSSVSTKTPSGDSGNRTLSVSPVTPLIATRGERIAALLTATGCLSVLSVAAWLTPSKEGHGTHTDLGLYECVWVTYFDAPCPTCGMTTAFAHAAEANFLQSIITQPFGALLAFSTSIAFWLSLHSVVFGSRMGRLTGHFFTARWLIPGLLLLLAAWAYKMATW